MEFDDMDLYKFLTGIYINLHINGNFELTKFSSPETVDFGWEVDKE